MANGDGPSGQGSTATRIEDRTGLASARSVADFSSRRDGSIRHPFSLNQKHCAAGQLHRMEGPHGWAKIELDEGVYHNERLAAGSPC